MAEIAAARKKFEDEIDPYYKNGLSYTDAVHPAVIAKELSDFMYRGKLPKEQTTFVSGGYGIARYTAPLAARLSSGPDPERRVSVRRYRSGCRLLAFGAAAAVQARHQRAGGVSRAHPVICVTGDAGFGYTAMELETLSKYRLPIIVIVYNNNAWGTWTGNSRNPVTMSLHLFQENVRYDKVAEGLGAHGEYVTRPGDFRAALERATKSPSKRAGLR